GSAVVGGVVDSHGLVRWVGQRHCEVEARQGGVALGAGDVVDGGESGRAAGREGAETRSVGDCGGGRDGQVHGACFVWLVGGVAVDLNGHDLGGLTRGGG